MNYWVYAVFYTFITLIVGQFFIEENLKLVYYMVMFLLYISLTNIYVSAKYYIKLRNTPGIKGERGDPGPQGQSGSNGVCMMANNCNIANCRKLIVDELKKAFIDYKTIRRKLKKNIELNTKEKSQLKKINTYIDILIPQCEKSENARAFSEKIKDTIK